MSQFRIQKRMYAPNILEVETSGLDPKDKNYKGGKWKPYLAPLVGKKEGDIVIQSLFNLIKTWDSYKEKHGEIRGNK
jgi:hypothetical protein